MSTWAAKFGDKQLCVMDLPIADIQRVAEQHSTSWITLIEFPATKSTAFLDLLALAAEQLEVEWVRPTTGRETLAAFADNLVEASDELPVMWSDGNPQVGDQTTE